jgi:uncharacterized cupin superfamily protein
VEVFNVFGEQEWEAANDRAGFRHRRTAFGKVLGARLLGGSLYELPPGERMWPYHYEQGCEEWVLVVSGRPIFRGPDGERELAPGDVVVCPEGPTGAHQVRNDTDEPVRAVVLSSKAPLAVVHYPDSDKVGIWSQADGYQTLLRTDATVDYWEGEEEEA